MGEAAPAGLCHVMMSSHDVNRVSPMVGQWQVLSCLQTIWVLVFCKTVCHCKKVLYNSRCADNIKFHHLSLDHLHLNR